MKLRHLFSLSLDFIYKKRGAYGLSIVIGIILCYFFDLWIVGYDSAFYTESQVETFFTTSLKDVYCVHYEDYLDENYYTFYQKLYKLEGFDAYGTFDRDETMLWEKGVDYSPYFSVPEDEERDIWEEEYDPVEMNINGELIPLLGLVDEEGNPLAKEYEGNPRLIYIGSKYKDSLPVGTVLKSPYDTEEPIYIDTDMDTVKFLYEDYVVAGVLAEGQKVLPTNDIENQDGTLQDVDDRAIIYVKPTERMSLSTNFYFTAAEPEQVTERIQALAEECGVGVKVSTISDILHQMRRDQFVDLKHNGMMMVLILCMAIISVSSTSVIMLMVRKNEVGILYASGVTKANLSVVIAIVNLLCMGISGVLAFALRTLRSYSLYRTEGDMKGLRLLQNIRYRYVSWQIGIVCVFIALLSWVISVKLINRYSIRQMIGNNE